MSWHERIDSELIGSYRGVPFHVDNAETKGGQRWLLHEYPRRDRPYSEDMGRKARAWTLTLFVAGDDYDRQRDALIDAFDAPGTATLVHPYLGRFAAVASEVSWSESSRNGGVCTFTVTFAEAGDEAYPVTTVDSRREVEKSADHTEARAKEDFGKTWSVDGLSDWSLADLEYDLNDMLGDLDDLINGIADDIAAEFRAPGNMAGAMMGAFNRFSDAVMRPGNALSMYSGESGLSDKRAGAGGGCSLSARRAGSGAWFEFSVQYGVAPHLLCSISIVSCRTIWALLLQHMDVCRRGQKRVYCCSTVC